MPVWWLPTVSHRPVYHSRLSPRGSFIFTNFTDSFLKRSWLFTHITEITSASYNSDRNLNKRGILYNKPAPQNFLYSVKQQILQPIIHWKKYNNESSLFRGNSDQSLEPSESKLNFSTLIQKVFKIRSSARSCLHDECLLDQMG